MKKKREKKGRVVFEYMRPEDLGRMISDAFKDHLDRHPSLQAARMVLDAGTKKVGSIAADGFGDTTVRVKSWKKPKLNILNILFALSIPLILSFFIMGFLTMKDGGAPAGAKYRIRHDHSRSWEYSATKPQMLQGSCVFWTDLEGRGSIACGRLLISEVPGRILLPESKP